MPPLTHVWVLVDELFVFAQYTPLAADSEPPGHAPFRSADPLPRISWPSWLPSMSAIMSLNTIRSIPGCAVCSHICMSASTWPAMVTTWAVTKLSATSRPGIAEVSGWGPAAVPVVSCGMWMESVPVGSVRVGHRSPNGRPARGAEIQSSSSHRGGEK